MIDMNKKYRTRDGREVRVICVDKEGGDYPVVALLRQDGGHETMEAYTCEGRYAGGGLDHSQDLIEVGPYDHLEIDQKILVWDVPSVGKLRGHFAGVNEDGLPTTWKDGQTSFTATWKTTWKYCEAFEE